MKYQNQAKSYIMDDLEYERSRSRSYKIYVMKHENHEKSYVI